MRAIHTRSAIPTTTTDAQSHLLTLMRAQLPLNDARRLDGRLAAAARLPIENDTLTRDSLAKLSAILLEADPQTAKRLGPILTSPKCNEYVRFLFSKKERINKILNSLIAIAHRTEVAIHPWKGDGNARAAITRMLRIFLQYPSHDNLSALIKLSSHVELAITDRNGLLDSIKHYDSANLPAIFRKFQNTLLQEGIVITSVGHVFVVATIHATVSVGNFVELGFIIDPPFTLSIKTRKASFDYSNKGMNDLYGWANNTEFYVRGIFVSPLEVEFAKGIRHLSNSGIETNFDLMVKRLQNHKATEQEIVLVIAHEFEHIVHAWLGISFRDREYSPYLAEGIFPPDASLLISALRDAKYYTEPHRSALKRINRELRAIRARSDLEHELELRSMLGGFLDSEYRAVTGLTYEELRDPFLEK